MKKGNCSSPSRRPAACPRDPYDLSKISGSRGQAAGRRGTKKILFIDRDGTLVEEPADNQVDGLGKIRLCQGVILALRRLMQAGFELVMVSNQDGLGTDAFPSEDFQRCHDFILTLFASQGITFRAILICPHTSAEQCRCRKPATGLVEEFLRENAIDRAQSRVIGDRDTDRIFADNLGLPFLPVNASHGWEQIEQALLDTPRSAHIKRQTGETAIDLSLQLDSSQASAIRTPIAFFSHMLEQVARHGGFCLQLNAAGDVEVDDHHLIEDTAIALGEALKEALGDKRGIQRYGFTLPMDEALASVSIDICSRSFCAFEAPFTREYVGSMATEMVPHFFNSLAGSLGASVHVKANGQNHHHMIEACFKALGRALRQATHKTGDELPTTKGVL